jgi:hypothetical protein
MRYRKAGKRGILSSSSAHTTFTAKQRSGHGSDPVQGLSLTVGLSNFRRHINVPSSRTLRPRKGRGPDRHSQVSPSPYVLVPLPPLVQGLSLTVGLSNFRRHINVPSSRTLRPRKGRGPDRHLRRVKVVTPLLPRFQVRDGRNCSTVQREAQ